MRSRNLPGDVQAEVWHLLVKMDREGPKCQIQITALILRIGSSFVIHLSHGSDSSVYGHGKCLKLRFPDNSQMQLCDSRMMFLQYRDANLKGTGDSQLSVTITNAEIVTK